MRNTVSRFIGAIGLIAGTTIGAAMLALPLTTGLAGFWPSIAIMSGVWLFMMLTAFYFLEVNLRFKQCANLVTMAATSLGIVGKIATWIVYLLLLYALIAAYVVGCSQILADLVASLTQLKLPFFFSSLLILALFGSLLYRGTRSSDLFNRLLLIGLVVSYLLLIALCYPHVEFKQLTFVNWQFAPVALSIIVTSFGYHIIIPTLVNYLDADPRLLVKAIVLGSIIPFAFYLLWQLTVLGIIPPTGAISLEKALAEGEQTTHYLQQLIGSSTVCAISNAFAFFAIVTSLIGVSLSLADFLSDGLKLKKNRKNRLLLTMAVFVPPLLFAFFYPKGFIAALHYAGIFVLLLLALLPTLMVYSLRYFKKARRQDPTQFKVFGGKPLLLFTLTLSLLLLVFEIVK